MAFDPITFLEQYKIPYVTTGRNVSEGRYVGLQCPWCGSADTGMHMGFRIAEPNVGSFHCWRVGSHSGRGPVPLVAQLLKVSNREAARIVGTRRIGTDKLEQLVAKFNPQETEPEEAEGMLEMPDEFVRLKPTGFGKAAWNYLRDDRQYDPYVKELVKRFDLSYAYKGRWARRIIVPVYMDGVLSTWTGRAIDPDSDLRYLTLSADPDKAAERGDPVATTSIKNTLFNYDRATYGGSGLIVCEGPFDAMWVDLHGHKLGAVATCLYTNNATSVQLELLRSLGRKFRKIVLLLDKGTVQQQLELRAKLSDLNLVVAEVPSGFKDPGEMDPKVIKSSLATTWLK